MLFLAIRNIFFTIVQPGVIAGLIPFLILKHFDQLAFELTSNYHYIGALIFTLGFLILVLCICDIANLGKGTLSPADPTQKLVIKGIYRFSRNPMYIGVILILVGEAVYMRSIHIALYMIFVYIGFYFFVKLVEEPRLQKDFGEDYLDYKKKVRRWV